MKSMDTPPATNMVSLTIEGAQANLTLTRPGKFNAMNVDMIQELIALLSGPLSEALDDRTRFTMKTDAFPAPGAAR